MVCPEEIVVRLSVLVEAVVDNLCSLSTLYTLGVAEITLHRLYPSLQLLYQAVEQCS